MQKTGVCANEKSFSDCELAILRTQVDQAQKKIAKIAVNTPEVKQIITIVENFLKKKHLVCYGGISINALLPKKDKIYNFNLEIPDYDFFSPRALEDAKELADLFFSRGYTEVEAKSGQHHGTYKVFVNFLPVADITNIPYELFKSIKKQAVRVDGILYTDANYLRMGMYLELSRPDGDTSRWEKVLKRLTLINKHYPLKETNKLCDQVEFQRKMENETNQDVIFDVTKDALISQGVVFFGGFAMSNYSRYMPKQQRFKVEKIADFDVLSTNALHTAKVVRNKLISAGIKDVNVYEHQALGEIIPKHYDVRIGTSLVVFIYEPLACHSYNTIRINKKDVKIATIDTMLSFYMAFLYSQRPYYVEFKNRILCMAHYLFELQQKNRLKQKGLLKRFSITCYGHQETVEEMRAEKARKYEELKNKRGSPEYEEWFLNYSPKQKHGENRPPWIVNQKSQPNIHPNASLKKRHYPVSLTNRTTRTRTRTKTIPKRTDTKKTRNKTDSVLQSLSTMTTPVFHF